jgi:hypothetical protein
MSEDSYKIRVSGIISQKTVLFRSFFLLRGKYIVSVWNGGMLKLYQYADIVKLIFKYAEAPLHGHTEFEVIFSRNSWIS